MKHQILSEVAKPELNRIAVMRGEAHASAEQHVEFSTILGSCVATCLYDPRARIGGMNHFLLPEPPVWETGQQIDRNYGLFLMELLINEMLKLGASKSRIKARLYGGANINRDLGPIGSANAAFAVQFIRDEGIDLTFEDLRGHQARRIHFRPASGLVRCLTVAKAPAMPTQEPQSRPQNSVGTVELF